MHASVRWQRRSQRICRHIQSAAVIDNLRQVASNTPQISVSVRELLCEHLAMRKTDRRSSGKDGHWSAITNIHIHNIASTLRGLVLQRGSGIRIFLTAEEYNKSNSGVGTKTLRLLVEAFCISVCQLRKVFSVKIQIQTNREERRGKSNVCESLKLREKTDLPIEKVLGRRMSAVPQLGGVFAGRKGGRRRRR